MPMITLTIGSTMVMAACDEVIARVEGALDQEQAGDPVATST